MKTREGEKRRLVVASDFDGTLLAYDIAEKILARFALPGWREYDVLLAQGKVTLEECMVAQYGMIRAASREEILDSVSKYFVFRGGVRELIATCGDIGAEFFVVSAGLDFTIRHAFEEDGIRTPELVCPVSTMRSDGSIGVTFPRFDSPGENYKERLVSYHQAKGDVVVFMGNGMGDFAAAGRADVVFAIRGSTLEKRCVSRGIPHTPIKDFTEVTRALLASEGSR